MDVSEHTRVVAELEHRLALHKQKLEAFHDSCTSTLAHAMALAELLEAEHRALQSMCINMRDVLHALEDQKQAEWN